MTMRNRHQEMQDFIVYLSTIYKINEDKNFTFEDLYSFIYTELVRMGTNRGSEADFSNEGNHTFERLESYFSNRRNTHTYVDPINNYFLQIQNKPELHLNNVATIKLYIPQNANNMERSARVLFDFIDDANISHISKISKNERFDDIVVQVTNMNDAIKILNFAKGNRQIQNGLLPPNPFCYSSDGIAMSYGRNGSTINTVVASLLAAYSSEKISSHTTDEMFLLDFISFTRKYYEKHFTNLEDIGEVVADFNLKQGETNTSENNRRIANVGHIIKFFIDSVYPMYSLNDFNKDFLETSNTAKILAEATEIGIRRREKSNAFGEKFVGTIDNILLESVDTFKSKYHIDDENALKIVKNYLEDKNSSKITRDNDIRNKYIKSDFSNKMAKLLEISKKDLDSYYYEKKKIRAVDSLNEAIMETYLKYEDRYEQGFEQVDGIDRSVYALKRLLLIGEADGFTRNNNARANLIKYKDDKNMFDDILEIPLDHKEQDMNELCRKYITNVISSKEQDKEISHLIQ